MPKYIVRSPVKVLVKEGEITLDADVASALLRIGVIEPAPELAREAAPSIDRSQPAAKAAKKVK
jgi:hypothetical protein